MANNVYFNFLGSFWDNLPQADKDRMAEVWQGYEQVVAALYQRFLECDLNISVRDLLPYTIERWLPYAFTSANQVLTPPTYTSPQDLSSGVDLTTKYLLKFQIGTSTPFEIDLRTLTPSSVSLSDIISKINLVAGFKFARAALNNSVVQLVSPGTGPSNDIAVLLPSNPLADATEHILGILQGALPQVFPQYPFSYTLPYDRVVSIPSFQDSVRDESMVVSLAEDTDYALNGGTISFKQVPPTSLWAKQTYFNDETPWNTFGYLMGIYQKNTPAYLAIIQGLWFAYWNGPTPTNIKSALYLLFGLPVAKEVGTVTAVTDTTIQTTSTAGVVHTFNIPTQLQAIVAVGDAVTQFQPLVNGIDVFDKVNTPNFVANLVGRSGIQGFLTEQASVGVGDTDETKALTLLLEHTFLPQISVSAFISADINLANVLTFLRSIKPLNKAFYPQIIVGNFNDALTAGDSLDTRIELDITPNVDSNQTTLLSVSDLATVEASGNLHGPWNLDSDGFHFGETVSISVFQNGTLINTVNA